MNNDIWSIFVISIIGLIIFTGVGTIADFAYDNGLLSTESNIEYLIWNMNFVTLEGNYTSFTEDINVDGVNQLEKDPDVNALDSFVKEYGEAKARIGVMRNSMRMISILPAMVFNSIPFIDREDVKYYIAILTIVIFVSVGIAIIKALFQRRVDDK